MLAVIVQILMLNFPSLYNVSASANNLCIGHRGILRESLHEGDDDFSPLDIVKNFIRLY